ncbi:MAG: DNA mismatch repair endonuclease MutL [Bacteroidota bacterium]
MANVIKILPPELASKIAAGEVVQRPASVVKELVENSIDAGARTVTVVIKEAGKSLIQVVDDGMGMNASDARLAFERHATSKISTYDDLENIRTLGFRGEALASIAAVAQVELKTRRASDEAGALVRLDGGEMKQDGKVGMEPGTSVAVKNLFYNTPARIHFLKSNATEFKHVYETLQRSAISHPEIAFRFVSESEVVFDVKPSTLEDRLAEFFGEKQVKLLLPVEEQGEIFQASGYLGKPEYARKVPTEQFLFLNKRFIINRNLNHAVYSGYEHLIEKGSYPFVLLFLEIDPHRVDVNVHPTKLEVKFEDERSVYRFVMMAVRRTLSEHNLIPAIAVESEAGTETGSKLSFTRISFGRSGPGVFSGRGSAVSQTFDVKQLVVPTEQEVQELETSSTGRKEGLSATVRPLAQIQNKYILSEAASDRPTDQAGLMIIDQHAAHERILYEQVLPRLEREAGQSQQLLFPQTLELSPVDYATVTELHPFLEKIGFQVKLFGKQTIVVEGVPPDVKPGHEGTIFQEMLEEYKDEARNPKSDSRDRLAKSYACRAAIKAGDKLSQQEMVSLVDRLFTTQVPYVCPHGRPVSIKVSIEELDKRFGRL